MKAADVDSQRELAKSVEEVFCCQWSDVGDSECVRPARWLIVPRLRCQCGGVLPPVRPLLCHRHKDELARGGYGCVACYCVVLDCTHIIRAFVELP